MDIFSNSRINIFLIHKVFTSNMIYVNNYFILNSIRSTFVVSKDNNLKKIVVSFFSVVEGLTSTKNNI